MTSKKCAKVHVTLASMNIEDLILKAKYELKKISEGMRLKKLSATSQKTDYMIIGELIKLRYMKH